MNLLGHMEWVYGSILGGVRRSSIAIPVLRLEMAPGQFLA
jgi:hypothetical protein